MIVALFIKFIGCGARGQFDFSLYKKFKDSIPSLNRLNLLKFNPDKFQTITLR